MTNPSAQAPGPLAKAVSLIVLALLLVLGFTFSLVLLAVIPVIALVAGGWFWWKTRALRRLLREQAAAGGRPGFAAGSGFNAGTGYGAGDIIEGEAVVVHENGAAGEPKILPRDDAQR